jgi:hypothetical protein
MAEKWICRGCGEDLTGMLIEENCKRCGISVSHSNPNPNPCPRCAALDDECGKLEVDNMILEKHIDRLENERDALKSERNTYKAALYEISKSGCDLDHDTCRACVATKALEGSIRFLKT